MQPTHHETLAELSSYELGELERLGRHGRKGGPSLVGTDAPRLKSFGLVEYVRETRSGTTWWRVTDTGRSVLAAKVCQHKRLSGRAKYVYSNVQSASFRAGGPGKKLRIRSIYAFRSAQ